MNKLREKLKTPLQAVVRLALPGVKERLDSIPALQAEVERLSAELVRLDGDLDESRRLNLRAAELLDVVYEELGKREETPFEKYSSPNFTKHA